MAEAAPFDAPLIGPPLDRLDGPAKVTGRARFATDEAPPGLAHGAFVEAGVAAGRVRAIDARAARAVPGVLAVLTHGNAPRLAPVGPTGQAGRPGQSHTVCQDDRVLYHGQFVALVVAETAVAAEHAAGLVEVAFDPEPGGPRAAFERHLDDAYDAPRIPLVGAPPPASARGDAAAAYAGAPVRLDLTYRTPIQHHVPLEAHGTVAAWRGDELTIWDSTQHVMGARSVVAKHLGIPEAKVRVVSAFAGGAFGSKGSTWPHVTFAALAAREVGRPVRIRLTRAQTFVGAGHRAPTLQRVRVGADAAGRLLALAHEATAHTSTFDDYCDATAVMSRTLYSCPAVSTAHRLVKVNVNSPTAMRAPGEAPGLFALECAMDELATAVGLDPLELRVRNHAEADENEGGKPYSSKALRACYAAAAARFGWERRPPSPRAQRDGRWLVGQGMASAVYPGKQSPASARVRLLPDGRAEAASATHELGTGTPTALAIVAAAALGLPVERVAFAYGDTRLPDAPVSAGSQSVACVGSAVRLAADAALGRLAGLAAADPASPLFGVEPAGIDARGGRLRARGDPTRGEGWGDLLRRHGAHAGGLEAEATYRPPTAEGRPRSAHAFGAHFCEVRVAERTGEVRVARWTAAFGCGRIVNAKTARSQLIGGVVWGIGMALHEATELDARRGRFVNRNLGEYLVPVNADVPEIDAFFVEEEDPHVDPIGAKNVGEIGICGAAAAIANAVFHATGVRVRELPIRIERLLQIRV